MDVSSLSVEDAAKFYMDFEQEIDVNAILDWYIDYLATHEDVDVSKLAELRRKEQPNVFIKSAKPHNYELDFTDKYGRRAE